MSKFTRILFLDIDGVLNCHDSGTYYSIEHPETYGLDGTLVANLLEMLERFPDLKVVIHSGWIKHKDDPDYEWDFGVPEKGCRIKSRLSDVISILGDRYVDCVPYLPGRPKKDRIEKWLTDNGINAKSNIKCAVVDDDQREWTDLQSLEQYPFIRVFFTDPDSGLTYGKARKISEYFQCSIS